MNIRRAAPLFIFLLVCAGIFLYIAGMPDGKTAEIPKTQSSERPRAAPPASSPRPASPAPSPAYVAVGDGEVMYEGGTSLAEELEELLLGYMNHYYSSLAQLRPRDASALFATDADDQVKSDARLLTVLCGIRSMQKTDLSLSGYSFELTVQRVTREDNGDIRVRAEEESIQNFTAYPGVDSKSFGARHNFTLTQTARGWRLREHRQGGSLGRLIRAEDGQDPDGRVVELLNGAQRDTERRGTQGSSLVPDYDRAYDRAAAAAYAEKWTGSRNGAWASYDGLGGNCQNFVSQAILAGGIPMDHTSPGQWKWYSGTPNSSFAPRGRSLSWASVTSFIDYVRSNRGYGMAAHADAPYYSGERGDVISLGSDGDWGHTVMITDVIKDENGNTVDYLIASNTADLKDYPAGAYYYTRQMLIKIYGWNV